MYRGETAYGYRSIGNGRYRVDWGTETQSYFAAVYSLTDWTHYRARRRHCEGRRTPCTHLMSVGYHPVTAGASLQIFRATPLAIAQRARDSAKSETWNRARTVHRDRARRHAHGLPVARRVARGPDPGDRPDNYGLAPEQHWPW